MLRVIFILFPFTLFSQSSLNVELLDNWTDDNLMVNSTNVRYNDCWGFVQNGKEYAILGSTEGIHFFQISDENTFELLDSVAGQFQASTVVHRDIKVHNGYAYAVCDEGSSSLQIIDLSYLPDSVHLVYNSTAVVDPFYRVHNLYIDSQNELLFACSPTEWSITTPVPRRLNVYSISDPTNPISVWQGDATFPYVHDAYVRDNIAYLNCGDDGLRVYDFSNPSSPVFLYNLNIYQQQGYNHQGWMSPDGTKFVFGDETSGVKLKNCVVNPDHSLTIKNYFGTNSENGSIPHNIMLSNEFAYVAYYNEGLRIYDIRGTVPVEVGHYDTYPEESPFKMEGAWGIYSDLPSGRLLVSDRHNGLFLFDFREDIFSSPRSGDFVVYPIPNRGETITIKHNLSEVDQFTVVLKDLNGKALHEETIYNRSYFEFTNGFATGTYFVELKYVDYLGDEQCLIKKVILN